MSFLLYVSCGGDSELSRAAAAKIISRHEDFAEITQRIHWNFQMRCADVPAADPGYWPWAVNDINGTKALLGAGLIRGTDGASGCTFTGTSHDIRSGPTPGSLVITVARRKNPVVTGITKVPMAENYREVEFEYSLDWTPAGKVIRGSDERSDGKGHGRALLQRDDDGWRSTNTISFTDHQRASQTIPSSTNSGQIARSAHISSINELDLDTRTAASIIAKSDRFTSLQRFHYEPISRVGRAKVTCANALSEQKYWVSMDAMGWGTFRERHHPDPGCYLELTDAGRKIAAEQQWRITEDLFSVAMATAKFLDVIRIAEIDGGSRAIEYRWKWEPTDAGHQLAVDHYSTMNFQPQRSSGVLRRHDRGWKLQ
jgi:hypothetical protein